MSQVNINVPVLVSQTKVDKLIHYHIRPIFFAYPMVSARRFDSAVAKFKKEVRSHFKTFILTQSNAPNLLWYLFNPKLQHKTIPLEFNAGKQYVKGNFNIVHFKLQGKLYACLPDFSSYVFLLPDATMKKKAIYHYTLGIIEKLIRVYKKGQNIDTWPMEQHYAKKGNFITSLEFETRVEDGAFNFEGTSTDWMFAFFGGTQEFKGYAELPKVGVNLNNLYPTELRRAFYREEQVKQLDTIIYQRENAPIVLIGEEGTGKHTLVQEVIYRYLDRNKHISKREKLHQFWQVDPTRVIAGMSIVGMWQKRFEAILHHLRNRLKSSHSDKLMIDNVVALLRIGKSAQNSMTLSDVLKPYLEKRQLQIILVATPEEWKIVQEKDRRFTDLFQTIRVQEPDHITSVKMVLEQRKILEIENHCTISVPAIRELFVIHRNYFKRRALPGNVCKLLVQLAVKYKMQTIDVEQAQAEFKDYSGLNVEILDSSYTFEEDEVRKNIEAALIGQPQAVDSLTEVIHKVKAKLNNPRKPLGSFLFIGPTGVGKTEAAKTICRYLLGSEDKLMRFDMNEYIDASALSRLIGDYSNPEGQLTGKIRYNPFGVILFDEIEKAHPKIHDLLLQVLDDGRLTDSLGRTVDFANTIIIMTSNVGAKESTQQLGFQRDSMDYSSVYQKAVEQFFRPEFVNRIGKIVIFNALKLEHILDIAKLQIKNLLRRDGFVRRTTVLNISPQALQWVARRGYNSKMGGRALKRQIEKDLTTFTADQLIKTKVDTPIIFDLYLENERLKPKIEILDFADPLEDDWMPQIPEDNSYKLKQGYGHLLNELEQLEREILSQEDNYWEEDYEDEENSQEDTGDVMISYGDEGDLDWQYYEFKNRLAEKKEHIRRILLGFKSKYLDNFTTNAFRLKNSGFRTILAERRYTKTKRSIERILLKDKLFQKSALDELKYVYQNAPQQFNKMQSIYIQDIMDVAFMRLMSKQIHEVEMDVIEICISSAISNQGEEEMSYLSDLYLNVLSKFDGFNIKKLKSSKQKPKLLFEGPSAYNLIVGEQGYHLFYKAHQNPLPIKVHLKKQNSTATKANFMVVRLYDIWLGSQKKNSTLTDLRTGYTNQANINSDEFKIFLYAGLDPQLRKELSTQVLLS
ncbi:MAG: AAA family ATPase [Saprospiraceae bacterium]|nr:AAA family ATPase [Saprospiraceae bacterium]